MKFKLEMSCDDDALTNGENYEVGLLLQRVAVKLQMQPELTDGTIKDENGNTVGRWEFVEED